jgi:hypothetical protein
MGESVCVAKAVGEEEWGAFCGPFDGGDCDDGMKSKMGNMAMRGQAKAG